MSGNKNRESTWLAATMLVGVMAVGFSAGRHATESYQQVGGEFELVSKVEGPAPASVARGGDLEMQAEVVQATGLSSYGGAYMLTATGGVDKTFTPGCECVCGGDGVIFVDSFETGDTTAWSVVFP